MSNLKQLTRPLVAVAIGLIFTAQLHAKEGLMPTQSAEVRSKRINQVFNELRASNMHILDSFYDDKIKFIDPVHSIDGIAQIKKYYVGLYKNVDEIKFVFSGETVQGDTHAVVWQMQLKTKSLNAGKTVYLDGVSIIRFNPATNKVIYHRDYFDLGEFIYEKVPVLSGIIKFIKRKLSGS